MPVRLELQSEPIPGYRLIERLGGGGFGEVWKAEAPGGLHKAIKFVFGDLKAVDEDCHRAEQELKALSRVKTVRHPYILSLERYDIIDGQLIIVMELADKNLWDRFKECRAQGLPGVPRDELLQYMEESAEALDLMNQQYQLQHLDIKPQNLFLVHNHVKVADFGLVKDLEGMQASVTGGVTPVYAAPETFDGWVSRFCDQYSLAIVYQELLTGQRPFNGTSVRQLILQHLQAPPDVSPLPRADRAVIARALAKKPDDRYPACRELVAELRAAPEQRGPAGPAGPGAAGNGSGLLELTDVRTRPPDQETGPGTQSTPTENIRQHVPEPTPAVTHCVRALEGAVLGAKKRKAPPEIQGDGCLFPALVLGVGQLGLAVVQRLRENLHDRFGSLGQLPQLRTLLLDTDPEVVRAATRGRPGAALSGGEVLIVPLNRPSHYLKPRDGRPELAEWLNPRMLYRIPRSQVTTGVRALGRLAFCDHYRAIVRRLQTELDVCLDPGALQAAAQKTRLGLRGNRPRVYVVAGLAGGTGGGMFLDLAYTLRALLRQMGYEQPDVVGVLLVPRPDKNRTRVLMTGNTYAALTELAHYGRPGTVFRARYHDREAAVEDRDPPFSRTVLLPLPEETDEVATRELVEMAGHYLDRDLCSPLGRTLDLSRAGLKAPPWEARGLYYQTFGLHRLAWPRKALVRAAARQLCQRLVTRWMTRDSKPVREAVQAWAQEQWTNLRLGADGFLGRLREETETLLRRDPEALLDDALTPLARAAAAAPRGRAAELDPGQAAEALARLEELVGSPSDETAADQGAAIVQAVRQAAQQLAEEWGEKLAELPVRLIEEPQYRLAGAEEAIRHLVAAIEQLLQTQEQLARDLTARAAQAHARARDWLRPRPGAKRVALSAAEGIDLLRGYARSRVQGVMVQQAIGVFLGLRGHLSDELREVNFCRVRLGELLKQLEAGAEPLDPADTPAGARGGLTVQIFPAGCRDLADAVERFLASLTPEMLLDLDNRLQEAIRERHRALVHICLTNAPVLKNVELDLVQAAEAFAAEHVGEPSVAEMFLELKPDAEAARAEIVGYYDEAAPELARGPGGSVEEVCLLTTPPGDAGERFRRLAQEALPDVEWSTAGGVEDILICRERSHLPLAELEHLGPLGQDAYRQMSTAENFTPHTRIDVQFTP